MDWGCMLTYFSVYTEECFLFYFLAVIFNRVILSLSTHNNADLPPLDYFNMDAIAS